MELRPGGGSGGGGTAGPPGMDQHQVAVGAETLPRQEPKSTAVMTFNNTHFAFLTARTSFSARIVHHIVTTAQVAGATINRLGLYRQNANGDLTQVAVTAHITTWGSAGWKDSVFTTPYTTVAGERLAIGLFCNAQNVTLQGVTFPMYAAGELSAILPMVNGMVSAQTDLLPSYPGAAGWPPMEISTLLPYFVLLP